MSEEVEIRYDTTPEVDAIGALNFEGNIIPHSWYKKIVLTQKHRGRKSKNEKKPSPIEVKTADLLAINILADIVFWYRPTIIRDEATNDIIEVRKKFKEDKLQRSYSALASFFGVTKDQARGACDRLCKGGFIKREFKSLVVEGRSLPLANVMYVAPVVAKIASITFKGRDMPKLNDMVKISDTSAKEKGNVPQSLGGHIHRPLIDHPEIEKDSGAKNAPPPANEQSNSHSVMLPDGKVLDGQSDSRISTRNDDICPDCDGNGFTVEDDGEHVCLNCNGKGRIKSSAIASAEATTEQGDDGKKKRGNKSDSSLAKHPAIQVFRDVRSSYPCKESYQPIIDTVGDTPESLDQWRKVLVWYAMKGYNPRNVDGALDVFRKGIPTNGNGNGHTQQPSKIDLISDCLSKPLMRGGLFGGNRAND